MTSLVSTVIPIHFVYWLQSDSPSITSCSTCSGELAAYFPVRGFDRERTIERSEQNSFSFRRVLWRKSGTKHVNWFERFGFKSVFCETLLCAQCAIRKTDSFLLTSYESRTWRLLTFFLFLYRSTPIISSLYRAGLMEVLWILWRSHSHPKCLHNAGLGAVSSDQG